MTRKGFVLACLTGLVAVGSTFVVRLLTGTNTMTTYSGFLWTDVRWTIRRFSAVNANPGIGILLSVRDPRTGIRYAQAFRMRNPDDGDLRRQEAYGKIMLHVWADELAHLVGKTGRIEERDKLRIEREHLDFRR